MKKVFLSLFACLVMFGFANGAKATVLTFDEFDLTGSMVIPNGYNDFNWTWLCIAPTTEYGFTDISMPNYVFNAYYQPGVISGTNFTFNGAYFSIALAQTSNIYLEGFLNGTKIYNAVVPVNTDSYVWYNANFENIDRLVLTPESGYLRMDNFTYNEAPIAPVPEPSSMVLGVISLAAMGLRKRNKRK